MNEASAFELDALDSRIRELVAYARERSGEDRSTLFRNLVDLFLTGKAPPNNPTRSQLLDVMQALVPHVDADARRTACELIANMSNPPVDLVIRLAQDRASLAVNLLTKVTYDELDLIELIEKTGREHHQLIASREDLSANIWIALARAAPNALPFDHNSTLALWNEDLGITQTKVPSGSQTAGDAQDPAENHSATVTPLRPKRERPSGKDTSGSIRILRTDKDLIASFATPESAWLADETADNEMADKKEPSTTEAGGKKPTEQKTSAVRPAGAQGSADDKSAPKNLPEGAPDIALIGKHAQDPGPGGWAWISDRDGLVTSISLQGQALLRNQKSGTGASMLDLLGLNAKLGHPVARAFQRRSTIHDAPIFLPELEDNNRHWTLEATPFFSSPGGIFEGYEGILTPVVSATDGIEDLNTEDNASALFLDDISQPINSRKHKETANKEPDSGLDQKTVFQAGVLGPDPDPPVPSEYSRAIGVIKPTQQTLSEIASDMGASTDTAAPANSASHGKPQPKTDAPKAGKATDPITGASHDSLSKAAAMVVKEVLAEALAPLEASIGGALKAGTKKSGMATANEKPQQDTSAAKAKTPELDQDVSSEATTAEDVNLHITATFDLLEKALGRLSEIGKASDDPQARLQGEIASACVRSLKEHLK